MQMIGTSKILGIGVALPKQKITSVSIMDEIRSEQRFNIPRDWIDRRIGIVERRVAEAGTLPSDLAIEASEMALKQASVEAQHIDLIIFCGIDKDYIEPATAHIVQAKLGSKAVCMDVTNACQGLISGLAIANSMLASGAVESALICTGEIPSVLTKKIIRKIEKMPDDYIRDRLGSLTVGDAGGAMVLTKRDAEDGLQTIGFDSQGEYAEYCYYKYGESGIEGQMLMKGIMGTVAEIHLKMISNTYHYLDWTPNEVDHLVCHQVGRKPLQTLAEISEVPLEKAPVTYKYYGNTTTSSIPLALNFANLNKGDKILLLGGGSGISSFQGGIVW